MDVAADPGPPAPGGDGPPASGTSGLTGAEAAARAAAGQGNTVASRSSRPIIDILRANVLTRFNAILAALLGVIIVVGPFQDGLFGVVLVLNTAIGIAQELRAKWTLDRLALMSAPSVRVVRDGAVVVCGPADLVIGDAVELGPGDQVPLDGVMVAGDVEVDESLLSGEADPVAKAVGGRLLSASFVTAGSGRYRVEAVGRDSYAQQIMGEAKRFAPVSSELRDGVDRILVYLQWALVPVSVLLVVSQLTSRRSLADALRSCVAGVAAMIPEGLVLLTSVAFAVAVLRLARRRVLVQELAAVEGLARVDVLCIDKTGTLTFGGIEVDEIEVVEPDAGQAGQAERALAALASAEARPNPTLAALGRRWPEPPGWTAAAVFPFSSARRWSGADFGADGTWILGAPDVVHPGRHELASRVATSAAAGRRVVLLARAVGAGGVGVGIDGAGSGGDAGGGGGAGGGGVGPPPAEPVALVHLREQVRPDAAATLAYFAAQGVRVKVISGDHPATVAAVARAVGIGGPWDEAIDMGTADDADLAGLAAGHDVFGRVSPHQKQAMVVALQAAGHTVAMTGDGVNDVLALKTADVGVAMGSGSPATRAVAQLVMLDDAFATLPEVIAQGRRVIANVERVANLFLTKTVYATILAVAVGLTGTAYPLLPRHLSVVNAFTIGVPAFFLALSPRADVFRPGFVGRVVRFAVPCGAIAAVAALAVYAGAGAGGDLGRARTAVTMVLGAIGLWVAALVARPLSGAKAAMLAAMGVGLVTVIGVPGLRSYFGFHLPGVAVSAGVVVSVALAGLALEAFGRKGLRPWT